MLYILDCTHSHYYNMAAQPTLAAASPSNGTVQSSVNMLYSGVIEKCASVDCVYERRFLFELHNKVSGCD